MVALTCIIYPMLPGVLLDLTIALVFIVKSSANLST